MESFIQSFPKTMCYKCSDKDEPQRYKQSPPNLFQQLKETGILILDVKKRLTSTRSRNNPDFSTNFAAIHHQRQILSEKTGEAQRRLGSS